MTALLGKEWFIANKFVQKNIRFFLGPNLRRNNSQNTEYVKTSETHPAHHSLKDLGKFYEISKSQATGEIFESKIWAPYVLDEIITFGKLSLLIRKPYLEIVNCLNNTNYENSINKFILFGKFGVGKSTTMLQLIYYAHMSGWLVVHLPGVFRWLYSAKEVAESATRPGFYDLPIDASNWLKYFRSQNSELIKKLDLRLQNDYKWNIREKNEIGDSILSLIDQGITRGKYSCDVVQGVLNEVKMYSISGKVKTLLAIDDFSAVYTYKTKLKMKFKKRIVAEKFTLIHDFKNMVKTDWNNGAAILSCHSPKDSYDLKESLPSYQLSKQAFEHLSPFIPIEIPALTNDEMNKIIAYYRAMNWISAQGGDDVIKTLSVGNPLTLKRLCSIH